MHGIIYIDTLSGLDLDGLTDKKSPVFRREKSGNPSNPSLLP